MKIAISGYYGFSNLGDEAVLEAIISGLRRHQPSVSLTVFSADPERTARDYQVDAVKRTSPWAILQTLWESEVLLSGGGTLFQDVTSSRSLWYYLSLILLAKLLRRRVVIFAQGFGPIRNPFNRLAASLVFRLVDLVTMRDEQSLKALKALGVRKKFMFATGDPTGLLEPGDAAAAEKILKTCGLPSDQPLLGVTVREFPGAGDFDDQFFVSLAAELDQISAEHKLLPIFFPFHPPHDLTPASRLTGLMKKDPLICETALKPREMLTLFACLKGIVGLRLHSLVFATLQGVPAVGVAYDPKVSSFMKETGQPVLDLQQAKEGGRISSELSGALSRQAELAAALPALRERLAVKAELNFEIFFKRFRFFPR